MDEDDAYELFRQREIDDAADALRAHEEAVKRQPIPLPQPCHACGHKFAGAVCPICKEERPAYIALKAVSRKQASPANYPPCRYFPKSLCGCGERGLCLEAA
ncbi:MAG: hypothetical protein EPO20_14690 [Betaproteobacteria bacterium]|nr:MAG: hypothetical protein EPO20_14690 [Betaproteobacteria bacterium]